MEKITNTQDTKESPYRGNIYAHAFHLLQGYIYLLDKDCILVDCNANFLKLLGFHSMPEQSIGSLYKIMANLGLWSEEQLLLIKKADIDAILSTEAVTNETELPVFHKNGTTSYYQFSRTPLIDNSGTAYGLLVIFNDITENKEMSEQLEKIKKQLQTQNADQNSSLNNHFEPLKKASPPKILIVEDNPIAQKAAQAILMNNDCLVEIADTEAKFYELFTPGKYDLVFMDIGLEGTSGYIMSKELRLMEKDTGHHVPIIALTGFEADVVKFDCDYYQMEGVITKPLTAEQVKQIIQHYIYKINLEVKGLKSVRPT